MARKKKIKGKILNGSELAGFIKERQARQVRSLQVRLGRNPSLAIVQANDDPAINTYVRVKQRYGEDIGVDVYSRAVHQSQLASTLKELNQDIAVDAIIVQLPLENTEETDKIVNLVDPSKDVDGLSKETQFESATATAILWLLAGYNVSLEGKEVAVIGQGRLVGAPIADALEASGIRVIRCDKETNNLKQKIMGSDVVITGVGQANIIQSTWLKPGSVVVDAGTSGEDGKLHGDVEQKARERNDLLITPVRGGVGPLTVCSLFDNVLKAAQIHVE